MRMQEILETSLIDEAADTPTGPLNSKQLAARNERDRKRNEQLRKTKSDAAFKIGSITAELGK